MPKNYYVEIKLGNNKWVLQHATKRYVDALDYIRTHTTENSRYPYRVVREVRTIVFDGEK